MTTLITFALVNIAAWCWIAWCGYGRAERNETDGDEVAPSQPKSRKELQVVE